MINEKDLIGHFKGSGKLTKLNSGKDVKCNIELKFYLNSEIDIQLRSKNISAFNTGLEEKLKCSFSGELQDDKRVFISEAVINNSNLSVTQSEGTNIVLSLLCLSDIIIWDKSFDSHEELFKKRCNLKVGLLNFVFNGSHMTHYPNGHSRRDYFKINILRKDIFIKQLEKFDEINKILKEKKNNMLTSELTIDNSIYDENFGIFISDLLTVTSFSQKTLISRLYTKFLDGDNELMIIFHNEKKYPYSNSSPLIDSRHLGNNDIDKFLESTFNEYQRIKAKLKMHIIIDIICNAEIAEVLESRYLLQITALELAIERYRKAMQIDIDEDSDLLEGIEKCITNFTKKKGADLSEDFIKELSVKLAHKTFKNKVKAVIDVLQLPYSDSEIDRIKDNRNKIVHELHFKDNTQPLKDYLLLSLLVDKIILKILDYQGYVLNYINNFNREKII